MDSPTLETRIEDALAIAAKRRELNLPILDQANSLLALLAECLGEIQKAGKPVCPVWQEEARPDFDHDKRIWSHLHASDLERFREYRAEAERLREAGENTATLMDEWRTAAQNIHEAVMLFTSPESYNQLGPVEAFDILREKVKDALPVFPRSERASS